MDVTEFPTGEFPIGSTDQGDITHGHLFDGRIQYAQPRRGFRSGIEPVLLAAAIPARQGSLVLEGGCGAGAALLCLAARIASVEGLGIDRDPALVALARQNASANGWPNLRFLTGEIASLPALGAFDHACANPPYHTETGTPSPDASRRTAKHGAAGILAVWAEALARPLRSGGTLTFILPAALLLQAAAAFTGAGCPPTAMLPLWPKAQHPAKLLLLRGIRGSRAAFRVLPGLVLHGPEGSFTAEADAILRGGSALDL
jgi:tRNA1Val (adenine37-N6)-methyltransferase